jgi:transposase-like protein
MTCNDNPKPICHVSHCKPIPCEVAHMEQVHYTKTCSITCKHCGSTNVIKYGWKGGLQYYLCNDCHRKFAGNNAMPGMRFPPKQIAAAISMYYSGLSIDAIRRELQSQYNIYPSDSIVYEWVIRFTTIGLGCPVL